MVRHSSVRKQCSCLLIDDCNNVSEWRSLAPLLVYFALRINANSLIGRQCINRKEAGRVAGKTVYSDHTNPVVHWVRSSHLKGSTFEQPAAQRANFLQRHWV